MIAANTPNKYGVDVPAIASTDVSGNAILLTGTPSLESFVNYITVASGTIVGTDRYGNALVSVARANLTFRKHRRALRRA